MNNYNIEQIESGLVLAINKETLRVDATFDPSTNLFFTKGIPLESLEDIVKYLAEFYLPSSSNIYAWIAVKPSECDIPQEYLESIEQACQNPSA